MRAVDGLKQVLSRRDVSTAISLASFHFVLGVRTGAAETPASQFDFLSTHGNSNCTKEFLESISTMPPNARLQGSCCSEMERTRYLKHLEELTKYRAISDIPPNPYDMDAGLAGKLLSYYELTLTPEEQKAYDYAMANSTEKGPCCCRCWRWKVYGGLAKLLLREHGFYGKQITEVWDMSNGCGGA